MKPNVKPPQPTLFDVRALVGSKWQIVTERPVSRVEAAMIVAQQWKNRSLARLVAPQQR